VAVLLSAVVGETNANFLFDWAVDMAKMSFSRVQEDRADKEALMVLKKLYGHTDGADEFFIYIMREYPELYRVSGFFSAHPAPQDRLNAIRSTFSSTPQKLTPLPENI
jgi:predicted Zn-dependent protease